MIILTTANELSSLEIVGEATISTTQPLNHSTTQRNKDLKSARKNKNDEFYTQLTDIEKELKNYTKHFENKVVYCNCDDSERSNFWKYFYLNFDRLKLKRLIATHYTENIQEDKAYKIESVDIQRGLNGKLIVDKQYLKGNGDFRSSECIDFLKQSDIVCTNPPFSLFREYVAQLIEYDKKFLIIGNLNSITCKEIFKLAKNNLIWFGQSIKSGDREFQVPKHYPLQASGFRTDNKGNNYIRVKGVRWFTNLDYDERTYSLPLFKKYTQNEYPKYDDYDAINIDKTKNIPMDYPGVMGVPITFMDKYNPEQFEILGLDDHRLVYPAWRGRGPSLNGKSIYRRVIIKNKKPNQE